MGLFLIGNHCPHIEHIESRSSDAWTDTTSVGQEKIMHPLRGTTYAYPVCFGCVLDPKGTICSIKVLELTLLGCCIPPTKNTWQSPDGKCAAAALQPLSSLLYPEAVLHLGSGQPSRKLSEFALLPSMFAFCSTAGDFSFSLESSGNYVLQQLRTAKIILFLCITWK